MGKSEKKSKKKHKDRKEKKSKKTKKHTKHKKDRSDKHVECPKSNADLVPVPGDEDFAIPLNLMNSKSHAPETPEEYQKRQNRIRREVDPSTGRVRLIKGDSEILEEIVTKERHKAINKEATQGDGSFFQEKTVGKLK